jgi:hypothetical protein
MKNNYGNQVQVRREGSPQMVKKPIEGKGKEEKGGGKTLKL